MRRRKQSQTFLSRRLVLCKVQITRSSGAVAVRVSTSLKLLYTSRRVKAKGQGIDVNAIFDDDVVVVVGGGVCTDMLIMLGCSAGHEEADDRQRAPRTPWRPLLSHSHHDEPYHSFCS
eukprot:scaffold20398_cov184-Amphora_coffeaeformis.AAC.9